MDKEAPFLKAFNAKGIADKEVALSFAPSWKFDEFAGPWNAVLLGPRGSGKTTFMRMLTLPALRLWDSPEAENYRSQISYTGIFVPADVAWSETTRAIAEYLPRLLAEKVIHAAFTTNVLLSTVHAIASRVAVQAGVMHPGYRCTVLSPEALLPVLREICGYWKLTPTTMTFSGLRLALELRLQRIMEYVRGVRFSGEPSYEELMSVMPFLELDLERTVFFAVSRVDEAIGDLEGQWTLLFDEFEIAPFDLQQFVFNRFRSTGKKLLYKVALVPCTAAWEALNAGAALSENNDYRRVVLWYPDKKSVMKISGHLYEAIRRSQKLQSYPANPIVVFGANQFVLDDDGGDLGENDSFGQGKAWAAVFKSLQTRDSTFAKFLAEKEIDPDHLETSSKSKTGSTVRKIAPLVAFRDAYAKNVDAPARRGRKKFIFGYGGWQAIAMACEGNPRWLISVLNTMYASSGKTSDVTQSIQVDKIKSSAVAFEAMLSHLARDDSTGLATNTSVNGLLKQIGDYFFERLVVDDFVEEPPLSFFIDKKVSTDVQNAVRLAINHGAVIHMADPGADVSGNDLGNLVGKRFRLAYLLAPLYKLPLRATREKALSTILSKDSTSEPPKAAPQNPVQPSLF